MFTFYKVHFYIVFKLIKEKKDFARYRIVRVRLKHVPDTEATVQMEEHSSNPRASNSSVQSLTYRPARVQNVPRVHKIKRY